MVGGKHRQWDFLLLKDMVALTKPTSNRDQYDSSHHGASGAALKREKLSGQARSSLHSGDLSSGEVGRFEIPLLGFFLL